MIKYIFLSLFLCISSLYSEHILIIGGSPKEDIDGVRYFVNVLRPEDHGLETAKLLAKHGYQVSLITPKIHEPIAKNIEIISQNSDGKPIISSSDIVRTMNEYKNKKSDINAVVQLANISSIRSKKTPDFSK